MAIDVRFQADQAVPSMKLTSEVAYAHSNGTKFSGHAPIYRPRAHSAVIFAIAQLSCWCCILCFGVWRLNPSPIGLTLTITRDKLACESRTY